VAIEHDKHNRRDSNQILLSTIKTGSTRCELLTGSKVCYLRLSCLTCVSFIIRPRRRSLYRAKAAYSHRTICWSVCPVHCDKTADWTCMRFGMIGRMGLWMRQVVGFGDRSSGGGNFDGECVAPHCNQWGVCGVAERKCVNCRSCGLGWCVGSAEALVATRPIPKLLRAILLINWQSVVTDRPAVGDWRCQSRSEVTDAVDTEVAFFTQRRVYRCCVHSSLFIRTDATQS